jgi:hypothetical protein
VRLEETGRRRAAAHTCAALDLVLVTPLALVRLGESGGRRAHALDLVLDTRLELLLGVEEPGGTTNKNLVLQVIATISSVHWQYRTIIDSIEQLTTRLPAYGRKFLPPPCSPANKATGLRPDNFAPLLGSCPASLAGSQTACMRTLLPCCFFKVKKML